MRLTSKHSQYQLFRICSKPLKKKRLFQREVLFSLNKKEWIFPFVIINGYCFGGQRSCNRGAFMNLWPPDLREWESTVFPDPNPRPLHKLLVKIRLWCFVTIFLAVKVKNVEVILENERVPLRTGNFESPGLYWLVIQVKKSGRLHSRKKDPQLPVFFEKLRVLWNLYLHPSFNQSLSSSTNSSIDFSWIYSSRKSDLRFLNINGFIVVLLESLQDVAKFD